LCERLLIFIYKTTIRWQDCVDGFKQADIDMGSAYHRKLDWMNKAADIYLSENNKMAGFVVKFADESGISLLYGYKLNGDRKKNLTRGQKSSVATLRKNYRQPQRNYVKILCCQIN